jgi:hypothetical protein
MTVPNAQLAPPERGRPVMTPTNTGREKYIADAEAWHELARQDHEAAVRGIDADSLASMGPESVMTEPEPCCGYPELEAGG